MVWILGIVAVVEFFFISFLINRIERVESKYAEILNDQGERLEECQSKLKTK